MVSSFVDLGFQFGQSKLNIPGNQFWSDPSCFCQYEGPHLLHLAKYHKFRLLRLFSPHIHSCDICAVSEVFDMSPVLTTGQKLCSAVSDCLISLALQIFGPGCQKWRRPLISFKASSNHLCSTTVRPAIHKLTKQSLFSHPLNSCSLRVFSKLSWAINYATISSMHYWDTSWKICF